MDLQNLQVTEILRVENVEIYETHGDHESSLYTQGTLFVLYAKEYDWFILKLNEFNYGLSKNIPVLASTHENASRAYVLPNTVGNYVIKVVKVPRWQDLDSLENILRHNTEFAEKEGPHGKGIPIQMDNKKMIHVKLDHEEEEKPATNTTANMLHSGGKAVGKAMVGTATAISTGISSVGSFLQTKVLNKPQEAIINPKTVQRLETAHKVSSVVGSITSPFSKGLSFIANKVGKAMDKKVEKENDIEGGKFKGTVGEAALSSAVSVWHGMAESLDVIREGVTNTTTDLVTHQYGKQAGYVCKSTIGVVTNIGLPGAKYFKKA